MTINLHKPKEPRTSPAAPVPYDAPGSEPGGTDGSTDETGESTDCEDAEDEAAAECATPRRRALAFPDLRPYLVVGGGRKAVVRGAVIIVRWTHGVASGRPSPAGQAAEKDKPAEATAVARKGQKERVTADVVLAMIFVGACVALTAARYLLYVAIFVVIVFVPTAYLVGAWAAESAGGEAGRRSGRPAPDPARASDADDVVDRTETGGETGHNGPGESRAEDTAGALREPTEEERQIALYEWVRGMIGKRNGVHLSTLLDDLNKERERVRLGKASMADLRALLEGRGIPVQDQLKVGKYNRSGVKRTALPESFTPLLGPDGHAVRLLPRLPPSDLQ
ncbi:hypothetical protein [[Kitasatospora] papulosa]|uniref:hypothetical protein n=1 Tax=[Kitasatospora] papulosa TaxID=1464011 RepID=UPI003675EEB9